MLSLLLHAVASGIQHRPLVADAPAGTGLEWMTIAAVILPALLLVVLGVQSTNQTV